MNQIPLKSQMLKKILELVTACFGLVAALALNDAIQSLFAELFGKQNAIWAKFAYAAIVTVIVVLVTVKISKLIKDNE